jgi:FkbM family methyltransferase
MFSFTQYRIAATNTLWLFGHSFRALPFKTWAACWLPLRVRKNIVFNSSLFALRNNRLRDTIVDLYMALSCFHDQQYNPAGFTLREGETVIDIGGHIGSFALYAAACVGSQGRVIVYEPAPDNNAHLCQNVAQSGLFNVDVFSVAVAGSKGERLFFYDPANTAMHNFYQQGNHVLNVPTVTLADIFSELALDRCHFLKIDCEGAEYEILLHTPHPVLRKIDRIAMEYHRPPYYGLNKEEHDPERLAAYLREAGFTVRMEPENKMHGLLFASRASH